MKPKHVHKWREEASINGRTIIRCDECPVLGRWGRGELEPRVIPVSCGTRVERCSAPAVVFEKRGQTVRFRCKAHAAT